MCLTIMLTLSRVDHEILSKTVCALCGVSDSEVRIKHNIALKRLIDYVVHDKRLLTHAFIMYIRSYTKWKKFRNLTYNKYRCM